MMKDSYYILFVLSLLGLCPRPAFAFDQEFLTHGAEGKSYAGATVTKALGPPGLLYNPANIYNRHGLATYGELTLMHVDYQFKYPGYDPAKVTLTTPVPSAGASFSPTSNFTLGFFGMAAPAEAQKTEVKELPFRQLSEEPQLVNIKLGGGAWPSYLAAAGGAYHFGPFTLGLGLVNMSVQSDLIISDSATGQAVVDVDNKTEHFYATAGIRSIFLRHFILGIGYQPEYAPVYSISSNLEGGSSANFKGRKGQQARLGMESRWKWGETLSEVHYKQHSRTNGDSFQFLNEGAENENIDTFAFMVGAGLNLKLAKIGLTYGYHPTYVGTGLMAERSANKQEIKGNSFGNLDGISRQSFALASRFRTPLGDHTCGINYTSGSRSMPEHARGYGDYKIDIMMATCSIRTAF